MPLRWALALFGLGLGLPLALRVWLGLWGAMGTDAALWGGSALDLAAERDGDGALQRAHAVLPRHLDGHVKLVGLRAPARAGRPAEPDRDGAERVVHVCVVAVKHRDDEVDVLELRLERTKTGLLRDQSHIKIKETDSIHRAFRHKHKHTDQTDIQTRQHT
jgi:hypothetical protein